MSRTDHHSLDPIAAWLTQFPNSKSARISSPVLVAKQGAPQDKLDRFWRNFTTRTPGKATQILPKKDYSKRKTPGSTRSTSGPRPKPTSYDEAVIRCRAKVAQIVSECRRVNQRYRDPHFDIEIDLVRNRRDCLDSLDNCVSDSDSDSDDEGAAAGDAHALYGGGRKTMLQCVADAATGDGILRPQVVPIRPPLVPIPAMPNHFSPMAVHRVTDIFDQPQFFVGEPSAHDVRQGKKVADCWLMAALCTMSNKPGLIERVCVAHDQEIGVYGFVFHRDGEWFSEIIDDKLYLTKPDYDDGKLERFLLDNDRTRLDSEQAYRTLYQTNSGALYFAKCADPNETWVSLLEKAYAKAHGDYQSIEGGYTGEGIEDLTGGVTSEIYAADILDKEHFWTHNLMKVPSDFLIGCSTGIWGRGTGSRRGIAEGHAYTVMRAVDADGHRLVLLRNPWGHDAWRGAWSDGSKEWTAEWLARLDHRFTGDGAFWISYDDLLRKFQAFDCTRLFGPEWRVAALWTTLAVPWRLEYHDTRFAFSLRRAGPVVLVLSQLDDRYFRGLEGQYTFRLSFRVHASQDDDGDSYIVRSLPPYRMSRSVNVELDLAAGDYTVLVEVSAARDDDVLPAEDVARRHAKTKRDKLARVALAYDLAHAKGCIVETDEERAARAAAEDRRRERLKRGVRRAMADDREFQHRMNVQRVKEARRSSARDKARRERKKAEKEEEKKKRLQAVAAVAAQDQLSPPVANPVDGGPPALSVQSKPEDSPTLSWEQVSPPVQSPTAQPATPAAVIVPLGEPPSVPPSIPAAAAPVRPSAPAAPPVSTAQILPDKVVITTTVPLPKDASKTAAPESSDDSDVDSVDSVADLSDREVELRMECIRREAAAAASHRPRPPPTGTQFRRPPGPPGPRRRQGPPVGSSSEDSDSDDGDGERDPWNAVVVVGLRVYYKLEDGDDVETEGDEVVKIRVVRPNPWLVESDGEDEEDGEGGGVDKKDVKSMGVPVLDVDDAARDATKDVKLDDGVEGRGVVEVK